VVINPPYSKHTHVTFTSGYLNVAVDNDFVGLLFGSENHTWRVDVSSPIRGGGLRNCEKWLPLRALVKNHQEHQEKSAKC
jgi:hypothetical protein